MTRPIESNDANLFILTQNPFSKVLCCTIVLMTSETMSEKDDPANIRRLICIKLTADAEACFVN